MNKQLSLYIFRLLILISFLSGCQTPQQRTASIQTFEHTTLPVYTRQQLEKDFDLLVSSLQEAHTGIYAYTSRTQFDSLITARRQLLRDGLNGLAFYNIVAPLVASTREDHCDIGLSEEIKKYMVGNGRFLPLVVINLHEKMYILSDSADGTPLKGFELLAVNDLGIGEITERLFASFGADGYILTSKYRYLDFRGFAHEYAKVIGQQEENTITVLNPLTRQKEIHKIHAVSASGLATLHAAVLKNNAIRREIDKPALLQLMPAHTALLSFRTFSNSAYRKYNMDFGRFVDSSFRVIAANRVSHLIIDMRDNGGGSEGNEDILFSHLTDQPYTKYRYVQASDTSFSFLAFTDYAAEADRQELTQELTEENQWAADGKLYRKAGLYVPAAPRPDAFKGSVYVLISGWTYSGGAEFSTLMREHTHAVFIGEEGGGGYSGNTSGMLLELTLPATGLKIDIPILQFVIDTRKGQFGRGLIPDYEVQPGFNEFISGYDAELEFAKKLILPADGH
ncbi:MAG: S41 family peptidase [Chitinophagaceae bacterium]